MITDARTIEQGTELEADICIIGAGIAGIALAREFIGQGLEVCLVESGGLEHDESLEDLARGENVGLPYERLDGARYRAFGGGSRSWTLDAGDGRASLRLRALDPIDFEKRAEIPYSGWPFDYEHLRPYYERAHELFGLGPAEYAAEFWEDPAERPKLPFNTNRVRTTIFQFGLAERFYHDYREQLHRADDVHALIYANAVELETHDSGRHVERLRVACVPGSGVVLLPSGGGFQRVHVADLARTEFYVRARRYVLAAGGTENPRLLLLSNRANVAGLGNANDLVGRFFMEHPHLWSGRIVPKSPELYGKVGLYHMHRALGTIIMAKLTLDAEVIRREALGNYCVSIHPSMKLRDAAAIRSLARFRAASRRGRTPRRTGRHLQNVLFGLDDVAAYALTRRSGRVAATDGPVAFRLNHMSEQVPNPESRVTLADDVDSLGLRRVRLDWRLQRQDMRTLRRAQEIIDQELRRSGHGRLDLDMEDDSIPEDIHGGWHHMGTTRMHDSAKLGVVDANCRVHEVHNLFVSGSSVFPTGGYANPTLTIGALALRLADHLKREIDSARPARIEAQPAMNVVGTSARGEIG